MIVYLAEKFGQPYPIILGHTISLGILIHHGATLMPDREWRQETLGL